MVISDFISFKARTYNNSLRITRRLNRSDSDITEPDPSLAAMSVQLHSGLPCQVRPTQQCRHLVLLRLSGVRLPEDVAEISSSTEPCPPTVQPLGLRAGTTYDLYTRQIVWRTQMINAMSVGGAASRHTNTQTNRQNLNCRFCSKIFIVHIHLSTSGNSFSRLF